MNGLLSGLYGGFIATGPMTLLMFERQDHFPESEKSPLPPATLSFETLEKAGESMGFQPKLSPDAQTAVTMASHFAYGAAAGAVYGVALGKAPIPPLAKGIAYGLGVWSLNYLGITPALGFRAAAPKMPARRNAMMIFAHVVWGACLAYATEKLIESGKEMLAGEKKAPAAE
jgi:putative membrane protein